MTPRDTTKNKEHAIITVIGKDRTGIVMAVTTALAKENVNIEDITQTIMGDYFVMAMLVDIQHATKSLVDLRKKLDAVGEKMGQQIQIQHEKIFRAMHRV